MNTPQEQIALTKEWLRVQQMCLEAGFDNPFACIKFEEEEWTHGKPTFYGRPNDYEFALAIVEGRPVFKGDMLYVKDSGKKYTGEEISEWNGCTTVNAWNLVSWNPPRKTFMLNGEELPIAMKYDDPNRDEGDYGFRPSFIKYLDNEFWWAISDERDRVEEALIKLLENK